MKRYRSYLSDQIGKKLVKVVENCGNLKTLVFDDGTSIELESDTSFTGAGELSGFRVKKFYSTPAESVNTD